MDVPPAELYGRNPLAFLLMAELHQHPRPTLTTGDAARILKRSARDARGALADLVALGALERPRPGHYQEPGTPAPARQLEPRACRRCGQPIPSPVGKRLFCSHECKVIWHNRQATAKRQADREEQTRRCVICSTAMPLKPRGGHQLYCSRHCEHIAERRRRIAAAVEAGTAGTCATCGQPTASSANTWCSSECRPRSAGGKGTVSPRGT